MHEPTSRCPLETLTAEEAERVRSEALAHGDEAVAKRIGVNVRTLHRALARMPIARLTAIVIRSWAPSRI